MNKFDEYHLRNIQTRLVLMNALHKLDKARQRANLQANKLHYVLDNLDWGPIQDELDTDEEGFVSTTSTDATRMSEMSLETLEALSIGLRQSHNGEISDEELT